MGLEQWLERRLEDADRDTPDIDADDVLNHCDIEYPQCDIEHLNLAVHALSNLSAEFLERYKRNPINKNILPDAIQTIRCEAVTEARRIATEHNDALADLRADAAWGDPSLTAAERNA